MAEATSLIATEDSSSLERTIGFWGLTFVSLGSIIGSGWLLGALGAATVAGPAVAHLVGGRGHHHRHARLHSRRARHRIPGRGRHGALPLLRVRRAGRLHRRLDGLAPSRRRRTDRGSEASLSYLNSVGWVNQHFNMLKPDGSGSLNGLGLLAATVLMPGIHHRPTWLGAKRDV